MITEYVMGKPYFTSVCDGPKDYPYLRKNIECEVLIIGGGIDGSIVNYFFSNAGINTVLIEKNRIGYCSSSCSTCLLEYQLDNLAQDLIKYFTKEELVSAYKIGLESLDEIRKIVEKHGNSCEYAPRDTLLFSNSKSEYKLLLNEYLFRKENGFDVQFLNQENNPFNFSLNSGILAKNGGAEFNPSLFIKLMLENSNNEFSRIFEHTEATEIIKDKDGFRVVTQYGVEIKCKKIIGATGFNTKLFTKRKLCDKFVSYTIVSMPIKQFKWNNRTLLQDNSDPYHYIRMSMDNRVIVGGEDVPFKNSTIDIKTAKKKYYKLEKFIIQMFPELSDLFEVEYEFCGTFSATSNNLAVIGKTEVENLWLMLGYGANGIIYSIYGAKLLLNLYHNKPTVLADKFSPLRDLP